MVHPHLTVTLAHSRDTLLSSEPLPDELKQRTLELLREAGVEVLMSHRLDRTEDVKDDAGNLCTKVHFANGHTMVVNHVLMAISRLVPSTRFLPPEALDENGYVKIRSEYVTPKFPHLVFFLFLVRSPC
jgi:thioredoxin reductase